MIKKSVIFLIFSLVIGCGVKTSALPGSHPANQYFNNLEYPRIGMNQVSTSRLRKDAGGIRQLAKLDMVIINKSDDLFVDDQASTNYAIQLKQLNPNIKVLQYLNISDIWSYQESFKYLMSSSPQVFLKADDSNFIHPYNNQYGNKRYMLDSTQPLWQDFFATRMKKIVDQGMDGIFVDNIWRSNWQNLNISPDKFKQIQQGWETSLQKGRNLIGPNSIIIGNSPPFSLYQVRDMVMLEGKLAPTKESFEEYMNMTRQANSYGQLVFDTVKHNTYNGANFHYVPEFFLPVVLLTDNIWGFSYESPDWFTLVQKVGKIGYPLNPSKKSDNGVWTRDFTKGKVIFNESDNAAQINLPDNTFVTIDNVPTNKIILEPMTGIILKKK